MKLFYWICGLLLFLESCYGINKKNTEIHALDTTCLTKNAWIAIQDKYTTDSIIDLKWKEKLNEIENMPFPTIILYFKDGPQELVGISTDHYSVRYVYNPKIGDQVLNGLSSQLNNIEKKRIGKRIIQLVMQYQCLEGRENSVKMLNENQ